MKRLKKVFAVLLTLAMVLGMSITTFADTQTQKITVNGLNPGTQVSIAQIIKLDNDGNNWVFADGVDETKVEMTLDNIVKATGDTAAAGTINTNLTDLKLDELSYEPITPGADSNGQVISGDLPAGLYAIKAVDPTNEYVYSYMVAALDYENGELQAAAVTAKGQPTQPGKVADKPTTSAQDIITFTVTVDYPFFATDSVTKSLVIEDTITNATIIYGENNSEIKIPDGYGLAVNSDKSTDTKLVIELNAGQYAAAKAGDTLEIEYQVKVNDVDDLDGEIVENDVKTTVPDVEGKDVTKQAIVKVPTVKAEVIKADLTTEEAVTGSSATFKLYKVAGYDIETKEHPYGIEGEGEEFETPAEGSESGTQKVYLTEVADAELSTDPATGKVTFKGLDAREKYYVRETKAPEGYSVDPLVYPLTGAECEEGTATEADKAEYNNIPTMITVNTATDFTGVGFNKGMKFLDTTISSLPSTGGIGTTIFTIGGCAIIIVAAGLFFASRKKAAK